MTPATRPPERATPAWLRVGLVAVIGALAFVGLRLAVYDGDVTALIRIGDKFADGAGEEGLAVLEDDTGYDGQYFYRLSRDPLSTATEVDGIRLDRPAYRNARVGYPVTVWAVSGGGRQAAVPWAMAAVNVVAIGLIAAIGAVLARDVGRSPWAGLLFVCWPGLQVGLAFDLSEPLEFALLLACVLALRRGHHLTATALLTGAVLTRETALVLSAAIGATLLAAMVATRKPAVPSWVPRSSALRWHTVWVPAFAYLATQVFFTRRWGQSPDAGATDSAGALTAPMVDIIGQFFAWFGDLDSIALLQAIQLALILLAAAGFLSALTDRDAGMAWERWALVLAAVATSAIATWDRAVVYLRYPNDFVVFGLLVYLAADHRRIAEWAGERAIIGTLLLLFASSLPIWILI